MNILMTNHSLQYVGGTEKWTYTMARELARRGHEVDVLTLMEGMTSERMQAFARVADRPQRAAYDLILANHAPAFYAARGVPGFRVFTSHGPAHILEQPVGGADVYVAVSKETRATRLAEGFPRAMEVITNGVDLEEFAPSLKDQSVLVACKSGQATNNAVACIDPGLWRTEVVHYLSMPVWDMHVRMERAHTVIGAGRTAIEALACGCDVLLYDIRSKPHGPRTDGWVTPENVDHLAQVNFSTRAYGDACDDARLRELLAVRPKGPEGWQRRWAEAHADVREKVDRYLELLPQQAGQGEHEPDLTAEYEMTSN